MRYNEINYLYGKTVDATCHLVPDDVLYFFFIIIINLINPVSMAISYNITIFT